jgi:hypothetical protein
MIHSYHKNASKAKIFLLLVQLNNSIISSMPQRKKVDFFPSALDKNIIFCYAGIF